MDFFKLIGTFILDYFAVFLGFVIVVAFILFVYDRYIQRRHALLISYPVIGRFRYLFEALREPLRQYFAEESFYESKDKIDWVYKAAKDRPNFVSFSVAQPFNESRFLLKHSQNVLNDDEVSSDFGVVFGKNREIPFVSKTPVIRSAMSDGALSPEAVRAFSLGGAKGGFVINIGEGSLTSNHLFTHRPKLGECDYLEVIKPTAFANFVYDLADKLTNRNVAAKLFRTILLHKKTQNTYIFDPDTRVLFRVNWSASLEAFPTKVPSDLPDMIFQMSSGLYGVRDSNGNFDEDRFKKVMRFCKMCEIKIAQGAKQTGGKLAGKKVSADIAYYRGVAEGKDLFSPNRFPYAKTTDELLEFIQKLQTLSGKPVGFKIVVSDVESSEDLIKAIANRKANGKNIPDFITIDSSEGGSATAPLELMESIGLNTTNSLYIVDMLVRKYNLKDDIKLVATGKVLTPDDIAILLSLGADAVGIARGFMMSGGCIRARLCSGYGSHVCPIGMATQDEKARASYLVVKKGLEIANYHKNLLSGLKTILAVVGVDHISKLSRKNLSYRKDDGLYFDIDNYFRKKLNLEA